MRRLNAACAGLADFTPPIYAGSGFHILGRFTNTRNLPTSKLNDLQFDGNNKEIKRDNLMKITSMPILNSLPTQRFSFADHIPD